MSSLAVTALPECTWTAAVQAGWISELKPTAGQGNGEIQFRVAANPAAATRQADILINDVPVRITQQASPCSFTVTPAGANVGGGASSLSLVVTTLEGCTWTVTSNVPWLVPESAPSRSGPGTVVVSVSENPGEGRAGTIAVAGQTVTVNQANTAATPQPPAAPCTYVIDPTSRRVAAEGDTDRTGVSTQPGCAWSATSNASWIAIAGPSAGTGSGPLQFVAAPNPGPERTGTITVAGQTLTVTQDAAPGPPLTCTYAFSPTTYAASAAGGTGVTTVAAQSTCAWTASSTASWLSITAGSSGTGDGPITFSVAENAGPARSGTITVGGAIFTVNQDGGCTVTIDPTSQSFSAAGGTGTPIGVSGGAGCAWAAADDQPWITITSETSGTGSGSVEFTVDANTGPARAGVITIGGRTFTVSQASGCTFNVTPTSFNLPREAATGLTVSVTAEAGCAWTSASASAWIAVTGGASGSGNGTVTFSVERNNSDPRTGTLTVAGQTVTVLQSK